MPSFKRIFAAVWYVWNWRNLGQVTIIFIGGLFFLFGAAYYGTRDRLPTTPELIDLAAARELVKGGEPHFIRLPAEPDFSKKIYRTGTWAPFWGNCPPDEMQDIDATDFNADDLRGLLGCSTTLSGRVDISDARTIHWPAHGSADKTRTVSLAPVKGTNEQIWVKSEVAKGPVAYISDWHAQQSFSGILATYGQALAALPKGLSGYARHVLPDRPEAFVICPVKPYTGESLEYFTNHFWVPVKGSNSIFLWTDTGQEKNSSEAISGVLMPVALTDHEAKNRSYAHFETVVGHPLPDRIGIIRYPTAEAYNEKLSGYSGIFMIFGVLWTILGLIGITLYILAPGLIYDAWNRAFRQLPFGKTKSAARHAPTPEPGPKDEPSDYHPLMAPFQSLTPVAEDLSLPPDLDAAFKTLLTFNPIKKDLYLAFIQDFSHPNNPDSGLRMMGCNESMEVTEKTLMNAGQRHPGLAIHLLEVNHAPPGSANQMPPPTPAVYDLRAHDYVVLCHAPSTKRIERVVITAVFDGFEDEAREKAAALLERQPTFSLMGRVFLIGDSENGPCQALTKKSGSTLLRAAR